MDSETPAPAHDKDGELRRDDDTVNARLAAEGPVLMALAVLQTGLPASDRRLIAALGAALARSLGNQSPRDRLAVYQQAILALDSLTSNDPQEISAHLEQCLATPGSPTVRAALAAISTLALRERQVLFLCDVAGWPRGDVAALLSMSPPDVRRYLASSRSSVRAACVGEAAVSDEI